MRRRRHIDVTCSSHCSQIPSSSGPSWRTRCERVRRLSSTFWPLQLTRILLWIPRTHYAGLYQDAINLSHLLLQVMAPQRLLVRHLGVPSVVREWGSFQFSSVISKPRKISSACSTLFRRYHASSHYLSSASNVELYSI